MTLNLEVPSVRYTADGIITTFAFVFTVTGDSELVVTVDDIQQVENIDYTVENITEFGGDIEFIVAPADTLIILIQRKTPQTQQIDLAPFSEFPADTLEGGLDKLQKQIQEFHGGVIDGDNSEPNLVLSVFGRIGNVIANCLDYAACYAPLGDWLAHIADPDAHHNRVHLLYGADHSDVDTSVSLEDGSTLVYAATAGKWFGLNVMVAAGYGGVNQSTPVGIPDLGAGFEVLPADEGLLSAPRAVTQDFANNGLIFTIEGVWSIGVVLSLVHAESNSGRQIIVQLYNATLDSSVSEVVLPIARNQPGTYFSSSFLSEVTAANVGDVFQVRIGGGDTVTAVTLQLYTLSANHVSEWKGT